MVGFCYIYVGYYTSGWLLLHLWLELLFMVAYYICGWLLLHLRWVLHLWLIFTTFKLGITFMVDFYYIYVRYCIYGWLLLHLWLVLLFMVDYYIYGWYSKPAGGWWLNWFAMYPERCIWNIYIEYLAIIEMRRNRMWRILQIGEDDIGRGG